MNTLHTKSPCCQGRIIKFGKRRRQCVTCNKTWRIRKKKLGRKRKRVNEGQVIRFLDKHMPSLYALAHMTGVTERKLQNGLRRSRLAFVHTATWPEIPKQPVIIIADSLMITVESVIHTCYLILVRSINDSAAIITCPYWRAGKESVYGWYEAFDRIPDSVKGTVKAMVCDGHKGLMSVAKRRNWLIQRCHFHLLASLQGRRSRWVQSRHRALGQFIYECAKNILSNSSEQSISESLTQIQIIKESTSSPMLRKILSGLYRFYGDYRTYLNYPELHLPTTTNAVESLNSSIRDLLYRVRGLRTLPALQTWIEALLKHRQKVVCNGWSPTKFQ